MITLMFIIFAIFVAFGVPIAFALGLASAAGMAYHGGFNLVLVVQRMFTAMDSFSLMAIPFFMLAGSLMDGGGISRRIVNFANVFVGWITGGLAMVGVLGSMIFASVSGSAVATTAAMGTVLIPSMEEKKYDRGFSAAVIAASGTIGPIIPPSIPMVIYGSITGASIGALFVGGYIPGVMIGLAFMFVVYVTSKKRGFPKSPVGTRAEAVRSLTDGSLALVMPFIIIGGILLGIFTPTESGAVACVYAFIVGRFVYHELTARAFFQSLRESLIMTTMIMFLVAVASIFSWLLTAESIPRILAEFFLSISNNPVIILMMINVMLLILGTFMDCIPAIILVVPVLMPLLQEVGIDFIHFGVVMVVNLGIGLLTPPVGTCLFVASRIAKLSIVDIVKDLWPLLLAMFCVLMIITYIPQTITWLPSVLMPSG